jgi:transmembrane sensor
VAKNPDRPFFVDTDKVSVRAVGTAFNVTLAKTEVSVLVTEGKVQVLEHPPLDPKTPPRFMRLIPLRRPIVLVGGQRAVVRLEAEPAPREAPPGPVAAPAAPVVQDVTPAEIERALSWQGMRLEFVDMPLGDVVAEFNRFNRQRLVVRDVDTAAIIVGGNFRADNVDGFVRLLEAGFGIQAEPQGGNQILLRRAR